MESLVREFESNDLDNKDQNGTKYIYQDEIWN
jgi:hypothetical protein